MNYFNYFTEIEQTFVRRRGKHLLLSPLDWALIESWKEREIPLRIILRGIENVFDAIEKNPSRSKSVKSLTYCKNEVEALYEDWRASQVGKNADTDEARSNCGPEYSDQETLFTKPSIESHLDKVIKKLERAKSGLPETLQADFDTVLSDLHEVRQSSVENDTLDQRLGDLEIVLNQALLKKFDSVRLEELRIEVVGALKGNESSMDSEAYQRTFDLMLLKKLREEADIPRLSMFHL